MRCLIGVLLLALLAWAKKDKPTVEETEFQGHPSNLFYFDDSDTVIVTDAETRTAFRSKDAGVMWAPLDGVDKEAVLEVLQHPYNNQVAVVVGLGRKHWVTKDQGKSWKQFSVPDPPTAQRAVVNFHATDPDRMLFLTSECLGFDCDEKVYYTTNGFSSDPKLLHEDAITCIWAKTTDLFTTGNQDLDDNEVLCIVKGRFSLFSSENRLLESSDFFASESYEPRLFDNRPVQGITNLAAVKSYIVAAAKSVGTTELAMFVTDDTKTWHRAEFGEHKLEEDAYTLLESTNYSMQVDVLTTKPTSPMGVLLTSNSNGTFFSKNIEHTNRNLRGYVDFEKIQNIQGIVMVNTVDNWEEVEHSWLADRKVRTLISFDDGRTWQPMKAEGGDDLHLHSVTDQGNQGRIFSSPAPGIVMGVGNTGKALKSYDEGDLYVSDDAGLTWRRALRRPHMYEFGDQGAILVAIEDAETDEITWSINHGKDWEKANLKDLNIDGKIKPLALTTVPDSTSLKFVLTATKGKGSNLHHFMYSFDFTDLHEKKCKDSDFEDWHARVDGKGKPTCIMGHTQSFRRRKADAECFVDEEFRDPRPIMEDCKCTRLDYECDFANNFKNDPNKHEDCILGGPLKIPDGACKEENDVFKASSGYVKIPGNTCTLKGGSDLTEPVERKCKEVKDAPPSGKISSETTTFKGDAFVEYYYLERPAKTGSTAETVIMRTDRREAWLTHDHGKTWHRVVEDDEVVAIYPHQYLNEAVYLITPSKTVWVSQNHGEHFHAFDAPEAPNQEGLQILQFHPTQKDWLIWTGGRGSQTMAHVSQKGGDDWETLLRSVRKCQFVYREDRDGSDQLIYCEQFADQNPDSGMNLLSSDDFFKREKILKRDVINFATMAEYIVVAVRDEDRKSLRVDTSIDGQVFADARFPSNFKVEHQQAYTVLDSSTHAVFLHVTVNNRDEQEYGSIVKSNSNGTSYVLSVGEVNRNGPGYVDFEKMQGLEGVAIINRVANTAEADGGVSKKLKTYITHNDGAEWALIPRPQDPPNGRPFECKESDDIGKCSLHLHGYTERKDPRDTFSSASAVGLMMGTGNVGEFLGYKKDADTFVTRDGGLTWNEVFKGTWMWEFGDQGSILAIVKEGEPTTEMFYSLDEGVTWVKYKFSEVVMLVDDITTVPSDTSRNFLLWGRISGRIAAVNIDFSGLEQRSRPCKLDEQNPDAPDSDYRLWSPKHPLSDDDCLFGHVAQYYRKKVGSECYNGKNTKHMHNIASNCSCTRQDFECDYNYERQTDGSCRLVDGLEAQDPQAACKKDPKLKLYYDITGYRRIPLSTCQGGRELEHTSQVKPCPGYGDEFNENYGPSGWAVFFAVVFSISAAVGVGYLVWKYWPGKIGSIRLGGRDQFSMGGYGAFDREAPWIKYPVVVLSGIVAVVAALPMLVSSLWRTISTRLGRSGSRGAYARPFTSRSSFQRGRGDYAVVDPDEGELLGEDSDEET